MELPHLGQHCNESTCKQLDFLPMTCDACSKIFCRDHIMYKSHKCPESYKKDNQIPVCPLCNLPCPVKKGELPDSVVERHIESDCQSDPAKERRKVYTNKCSKKGCKQKELVPVKCETCRQNFCLRHRHEQDHSCQGYQNTGKAVSNSGAAAILRSQQAAKSQPVSKPQASSSSNKNSNNPRQRANPQTNVSSIQGTMTEDEALARAIQMSMNGSGSGAASNLDGMTDEEREDFLLAQALAASEQEALHQRSQQSVRA
ncbi:AN1-type zinc finger protein 2A-like isoform X2 [Physella acuta]|uniref:AN1-type zinc finger protein 2A-like isoform X2 n=1 Tax=Physella acuta TaxID=109671 RepID=UPI0027DAFDEE|nr:AN1-type zinc finger protein 2A-like isoform X2 [Physella acuta]